MKINKVIEFVLIVLLIVNISSCKKDDEANETTDVRDIEQYTPNQADWSTFSSKPFENGVNTSHAPDGVGWITAAQWEEAKWDGTIYDPTKMTQEEFYKALFPYPDVVRG